MNFWKNAILFCIGGWAYAVIEILFRGWTHVSMFVLGGLCFLLIGGLGRQKPRPSLAVQLLFGVMICTSGELLFGLLFNRDHRIWDYRGMPGNLGGQICPQFVVLWIPLTLAAVYLFRWCDRLLTKKI